MEAVQNPIGWFSNNCIVSKEKIYYLTTEIGTVKERILQEVECAIAAVLGDNEEKEDGEEYHVSAGDINEIARKVKWYMDLD